jgi:cyclopropane-fatty-acyl-phospholipid synthase
VHMLDLYVQRAGLEDGMSVLDLGCGWGSLSLYLAGRFPNMKITSASHSRTQKVHIEKKRDELRVSPKNLTVVTSDINELKLDTNQFDRVISIEMFEHMKNYEVLLERVSSWLKPGGQLFVHIFVHKNFPYHFVGDNEADWMAKYFFTGGTMPSDDLLLYFQKNLQLENHWIVNGKHYQQTSEDWLKLVDKETKRIRKLFAATYGTKNETLWLVRWRLFYLACAECFGYAQGREWFVSHYLFSKQ